MLHEHVVTAAQPQFLVAASSHFSDTAKQFSPLADSGIAVPLQIECLG